MKRYIAVLFAGMFCVACISLYLMMESVNSGHGYNELTANNLVDVDNKIQQIETQLVKNQKTISRIQQAVKALKDGGQAGLEQLENILREDGVAPLLTSHPLIQHNKSALTLSGDMCSLATKVPPKTDIQMSQVYDAVSFDNTDGGAWKQGFSISFTEDQWKNQPLKVFVVPHSHNDPGWLKTFERYYTDQTRLILDNMIVKLEAYPSMRFIYAEMSFFSRWWADQNAEKRDRVKKLLADGRLEVVTGGWVMTDEANSHYFAVLDQLIEGNTWLLENTGVKPESGWAIDPFGHSPTIAYFLKRSGIQNMLIQRTHYIVKKQLAHNKQLEFKWRQNWDTDGSTDMLCHMMPFYSYDVPHTCGPDPKVCCQFDFKRLPGGRVSCPWKKSPIPITPSNVAERSLVLLEQYRKKSMLYRNNVVLVPLGDDFRYDKPAEWDQQHNNYMQMFQYINSNPNLHAQVQFGTLSEYFHALRERAGTPVDNLPPSYPVLSGDFFSYADRDDHYWTGYFTSKPFYKNLDRVLEHHLRASEIIYSLARTHARKISSASFPESELMSHLVTARRSLGLFQHHDAITGTAKDFVVVDYGLRMIESLKNLKKVISRSAELLLMKDMGYTYPEHTPFFNVDEVRETHDSLPEKTLIEVGEQPRSLVFYNSLTHPRSSVVCVYITHPHVEVRDPAGQVITTQVNPYWLDSQDISTKRYKLVFVVTVPALGLRTYTVKTVPPGDNIHNTFPQITFYHSVLHSPKTSGPFVLDTSSGDEFSMDNTDLSVTVSSNTGLLNSVLVKESALRVEVRLELLMYGVQNERDKSGAYLFLPDGPAQPLKYDRPVIRVIRGSVMSEVHSNLPRVDHTMRLYNSPGVDSLGVEIVNLVDIRQDKNFELVMRINSDVKTADNSFYTDLNAFQYIHRKTRSKLPLQANFYPMPSMAFMDDGQTRLSVLTAQSLGVASLKPGWLEVMQDRRLNQDDNRGLQQGVLDNKRTPNKFRILVERRGDIKQKPVDQESGYSSLLAQSMSHDLIYPMHVLPSTNDVSHTLPPSYSPLSHLPCDYHLVNLRSQEEAWTAVILRRLAVDCTLPTKGLLCQSSTEKITLASLFTNITIKEARSSSLSLVHDTQQSVPPLSPLTLPPMEIKAYKIHLG